MLRYGDLLHLHTHVMLRYGYLGVGLGGVGWVTMIGSYMIGSRPPTESLSEIKAASLLEKNPKSARPPTIVFADGNRA